MSMRFHKLMKDYTKELQKNLRSSDIKMKLKYKDQAIYEKRLFGVGKKLVDIQYDKNMENKHLHINVLHEEILPQVREITNAFMTDLLFYKPNILVKS